MNRLGTETAFEVLAKAKKLEAEGKNIIHLQIGEPDFNTPSNITEAGKKAIDDGYTGYNPSAGYDELKEQIKIYSKNIRSYEFDKDQVVITSGGKPIMFYTMLALINPGDEVLYPNPGFPIYESMINFVGGKAVPLKLEEKLGYNFDIDKVESLINENTKLIILNSPNNPCGSAIDAKSMSKLANILENKNITILSDEIYSQFLYEGSHSSISNHKNLSSKTIILDGFSKSYSMTGWRIGYGIFPKELVDPITKLVTNSNSCTASFTQIAAIEALKGSQESVNKMVNEFKSRRDLIVDGLNNIKNISCPKPSGAFYVFPNITKTGLSSESFANRLLEENGVATLSGESFGEEGKGYIRISFANSKDNISEALNRIEDFVNKL
ncbi:pyridoxal phosphate-dependent aminotransferase [Chloroflexi bacterium]|nr:pyridoxal phosphate-dependent aminotransferase [Chloroflexota bacterium]|tara:strand:- start:7121 stop:8266 length:1146 start_codon:yes stop_codon:yes gene_type:complete